MGGSIASGANVETSRDDSGAVPGFFVTFEGIDGSGKTTVSKAVADRLRERGEDVVWTAEPTDTWLGDAVRRGYEVDAGPFVEAFLFLADRAAHTEEIRRHVAAGRTVVCDRYADSTLAYQGARLEGRIEDPIRFLRRLGAPYTLTPDLTLLLRVPPALGLRRLRGRRRRVPFERAPFLRRVDRNYRGLARAKRFVTVDATRPVDDVVAAGIVAIDARREARSRARSSGRRAPRGKRGRTGSRRRGSPSGARRGTP